ncbi:MAG: phosphatidylserine decarboxylase [Leptospiraceae bacterium]|nr:phosphatidylserine decarboxylase [Leptospiraceae bacterium]
MRFPQFRYLFLALKIFSGAMDDKGSKGQIVHSQSFYASSSSTILLGAIIGSSLALSLGGVGILFWIWIASIIGMPIRMVSSTLAIRFREKLPNGRYLSGPMYFIEKALKANWLAIAFVFGGIAVVLILGGVVPTLSMTYITSEAFGWKGLALPIFISALLIYVSVGGIRRVGKTAGILVPLGITLFVLFYYNLFSENLIGFGNFLGVVFSNAFHVHTMATGGTLGMLAIFGQSVGAFYIGTETGVGKSAGISGVVRTDYAFKHGLVGMLSLFFEGIIISTLTVYILFSNNAVGIDDQLALLSSTFAKGMTIPGILFFGSFILIGFVSIISWFYTGEQNANYLFGNKFANFFRILFIASIITASYFFIKQGESVLILAFQTGYLFAAFTAIPILVSLVLLGKMARFEMNKYFNESGARYEVFKDFYIMLLSILPKNLLSKLFGLFTYAKLPRFMMIPILKAFAGMYKINVSEAELNISEYNSLNEFFTRALKAGARIIDSAENAVVSPVDAKITSYGNINENTLIQAKGKDYSLKELLGSEKYYESFQNGKFITFYLSPQDYHRIHSPFFGKILGYFYAPGKLFPVNDAAVIGIKSLFPKNERLITFLQTEYGKLAVVKVGANNVGKIRVTYDTKIVTNSWLRFTKEYLYDKVNIFIDKGAELGRFEMGSTVILIFEKDSADLVNINPGEKLQYGTTIAHFKKKVMDLPKSSG